MEAGVEGRGGVRAKRGGCDDDDRVPFADLGPVDRTVLAMSWLYRTRKGQRTHFSGSPAENCTYLGFSSYASGWPLRSASTMVSAVSVDEPVVGREILMISGVWRSGGRAPGGSQCGSVSWMGEAEGGPCRGVRDSVVGLETSSWEGRGAVGPDVWLMTGRLETVEER